MLLVIIVSRCYHSTSFKWVGPTIFGLTAISRFLSFVLQYDLVYDALIDTWGLRAFLCAAWLIQTIHSFCISALHGPGQGQFNTEYLLHSTPYTFGLGRFQAQDSRLRH